MQSKESEEIAASAVERFIALPWFEQTGKVRSGVMVASDLSEAYDGYWDGWNSKSRFFWADQSKKLEEYALSLISDEEISQIFESVSAGSTQSVWAGLEGYLERYPDDTGVGDAIALSLTDDVIRDLCWVAVEIRIQRKGFFHEIFEWYAAGTKLFGWKNDLPPDGIPVVL
ncbi:hypothetical protein [Cerasicoccus maritimus]|uniref:hypothetical protein n=1 Tax=Cerasicoccus maritimus TaxID=490089 RepID=UPI002852AE80|nr:hypothetical protein [Cerasicoccus maritimus]